MKLSVITIVGPGREDNLYFTLEMLARQSEPAEEILVISDGAARSGEICARFKNRLPLEHLYRPNDLCPSYSRNLAASLASHESLVFLDADILPNPKALAAWRRHLSQSPEKAWLGWFGYANTTAVDSLWLPGRRVNYLDPRFWYLSRQALEPNPYLLAYPHWFFWTANWAISKSVYAVVGGFNEQIRGWGGEDLNFASRLFAHGIQLAFSLETWAEHQQHPKSSFFYHLGGEIQQLGLQNQPVDYPLEIVASSQTLQELLDSLFEHYLPQETGLNEAGQAKIRQAGAELHFKQMAYITQVQHHLDNPSLPPLPALRRRLSVSRAATDEPPVQTASAGPE